MPVFDFNNTPEPDAVPECTYTTFASDENVSSADKPLLVLDNSKKAWKHHSCGTFTNQNKRTAFEFKEDDGSTVIADIKKSGCPLCKPAPLARRKSHSGSFIR